MSTSQIMDLTVSTCGRHTHIAHLVLVEECFERRILATQDVVDGRRRRRVPVINTIESIQCPRDPSHQSLPVCNHMCGRKTTVMHCRGFIFNGIKDCEGGFTTQQAQRTYMSFWCLCMCQANLPLRAACVGALDKLPLQRDGL